MDQIYDAGPGAPKIVVVLRRDQGDEVLFRELRSALAIVAAEDPRYTVYVSTDAREGPHTPLDDYGNSLEQVLVAAAHEEVLFRKRDRDSYELQLGAQLALRVQVQCLVTGLGGHSHLRILWIVLI